MSEQKHRIAPLLWFLLFALCLWGFYETSFAYQAFRIAQGVGVNDVHHSELGFTLWYLLYGLVGVVSLTRALSGSSVPGRCEAAFRWLVAHRVVLVAGLSLGALGTILLLRHFVLLNAPIADDESTYIFISRTLLHGRVVNPLPGDNAFFGNQWIVFSADGWYGKYPIGHPLMLALGEGVGLRFLVVPLISFGSLLMTYVVGRRLFGELEACLALGLLVLSPQFMLTSATELSQPTAALFMLLGIWATVRLVESERWPWALAAGAAWGFGVVVRPFPGVLFLTAAAGVYLLRRSGRGWREHLARRVPLVLVALVPVAACAALMFWVNGQQTGAAGKSGYHAMHSSLGFFANKDGQLSISVAAAFFRQNVWLFGWPLSFVFLPFGRAKKGFVLLWAIIAAEYFYRVLVPKTVVATTGPIYVMEIVPLLALLSASGLIRAKRWLEGHNVKAAKAWVVSFVLASMVVGYTMFVPVRARGIYLSARAWNEVFYDLERRGASRNALVFGLFMVPEGKNLSWAYFAPPPSPSLDDDVIFVRIPFTGDRLARIVEFWQRRFPDRSAWFFHPRKGLFRITPDLTKPPPWKAKPPRPRK